MRTLAHKTGTGQYTRLYPPGSKRGQPISFDNVAVLSASGRDLAVLVLLAEARRRQLTFLSLRTIGAQLGKDRQTARRRLRALIAGGMAAYVAGRPGRAGMWQLTPLGERALSLLGFGGGTRIKNDTQRESQNLKSKSLSLGGSRCLRSVVNPGNGGGERDIGVVREIGEADPYPNTYPYIMRGVA